MSVINTNIGSLTAQRNLGLSQASLSTSMQRLSSGLRINSAKDDAAGLAISDRMTSQIRGANQAARNANDGISLAQTAEGALSEVTSNLQRIRELAVQSSNATNSSSDRDALQAEATQLTAEITRVASQTKFNGINLLDGSFSAKAFQVGADQGQTITVSSIGDARATALGSNVLAGVGSVIGGNSGVGATATAAATAAAGANGVGAETNLTITTAGGGTTAAISYAAGADAKDIAAAINGAAGGVGVTATATNSATLSGVASAGTVTMTLNGSAISVAVTDPTDLTTLMGAINGAQGATGVTASFTSTSSKAGLTLTTTDGRDIRMEDFTNSGTTKTAVFSGVTLTGGGTADSSTKVGAVSLSSNKGTVTLANANTDVFSAATQASAFSSLASMSLSGTDGTNAQNAIAVIDSALSAISSSRGNLGAIQNRFTSVVNSLQTTSENLSASRSRIQDADFAAETANLSRAQVLQQAGTAMVAQANQLPQGVLALLR